MFDSAQYCFAVLSGCEKEVARAAAACMGDSAGTARALEEFERVIGLSNDSFGKERRAIAPALRRRHSFNADACSWRSGAWVPGLFRVWLMQEGARMMGVEAEWRELIDAACGAHDRRGCWPRTCDADR